MVRGDDHLNHVLVSEKSYTWEPSTATIFPSESLYPHIPALLHVQNGKMKIPKPLARRIQNDRQGHCNMKMTYCQKVEFMSILDVIHNDLGRIQLFVFSSCPPS